jgi:mRNA interferase MazF
MNPRPGEIWLADLGLAAKTRPVLIISRFDPDAPRALVTYVPLITQNRGSIYEVPIPKLGFLAAVSFANVQGIASIPAIRLDRKLGALPAATMIGIRRALMFALDLDNPGN